jgi:hypothetical protein
MHPSDHSLERDARPDRLKVCEAHRQAATPVEERQGALICFREEARAEGSQRGNKCAAPLVPGNGPVRTGHHSCDMDAIVSMGQLPVGVCNRTPDAVQELSESVCGYFGSMLLLAAINAAQSSGGLPRSSIALNIA